MYLSAHGRKARGCLGGQRAGHLYILLFTWLYFPNFLPRAPITAQARRGWYLWGALAWGVRMHHAPSQRALEPPASPVRLPQRATSQAQPTLPHSSLRGPRPPPSPTCTRQTTNRLDGRLGPSSSGTARCSWSLTKRKTLLFVSSRCPRPPTLHSGTVLISIFHSTAIKWKTLFKQCAGNLVSHEMHGKGSWSRLPRQVLRTRVQVPQGQRHSPASLSRNGSWSPPPRPEPQTRRMGGTSAKRALHSLRVRG